MFSFFFYIYMFDMQNESYGDTVGGSFRWISNSESLEHSCGLRGDL